MKTTSRILIYIFICVNILSAQYSAPNPSHRRIAGFGSSVCSGTGDRTNNGGYIGQLKKIMKEKGWEVVNVSRGGDNTRTIEERFNKDDSLKTSNKEIRPDQYLVQAKPDYVLIGLSLANQGIIKDKAEQRDSAFTSFGRGLFGLITKCRNAGFQVAIGGCYSNNQFLPEHYSATKKMNIQQNGLGVPVFNFLGTVDNGDGHWVPGFYNDDWHPSYGGHKEMFYAIVPTAFAALEKGKPVPVFENSQRYAKVQTTDAAAFTYIPEDTIHSFTLSFLIKGGANCQPVVIKGKNGILNFVDFSQKGDSSKTYEVIAGTKDYNGVIAITDGIVTYSSTNGGIIKSTNEILTDKWLRLTITHMTSKGETKLYINDLLIGSCVERIIPIEFDLAVKSTADYKDILIYRSVLNCDEINAVLSGNLIHSSLEVYAPLNDSFFTRGNNVANFAQSLSVLKINGKIEPAIK